MAFHVGDTVGGYQVIGILGAGGMGEVYKVRNVTSGRVEAMKVLLPDLAGEPELADRLTREMEPLASLSHPNIAAFYTTLRSGNQLLMVTEFVEGRTLEDRLREGRIPVAEAMDCASQALAALGYAHERGLVHGDIKPANMMLASSGELKLMNFGIAKALAAAPSGSLYYMSPERVQGGATLDGRSDLYSAGVLLHELVTGAHPPQGGGPATVAQLDKQLKAAMEIDPSLPAALNDIILTAIRKDPAERFQKAQAFRNALASVRASLPTGTPAKPAIAAAAVPPPLPPSAAQPSPGPFRAAPESQAPATPAAPPPTAQPASHRGLYMALGALVALAILALAAVQLPRWYRARAGAVPAQATQGAQPSPQPEAQPVSQPTPKLPAAGASGTPLVPAAPEVKPAEIAPARARHNQTSAPPAPAAAQQPASAPTVDLAALEAARERMGMLAVRANAVRGTLQHLEAQQRAQGYGLRMDISASAKRMEYLLDQAQRALGHQDPEAANRNLDLAERETDKIEAFLGH